MEVPLVIPQAAAAHEKSPAARAAQDFESLLIGSLLRSLESSFGTVPGDEVKEAGSDDYRYMATQALSNALAERGGLGIARQILDHLKVTKGLGEGPQIEPGQEVKSR